MLSSLASKYSRTDINSGCRTVIKTVMLFTRERFSSSPADLTPLGGHETPLTSPLQKNHSSSLALSHRIKLRDVSQRHISLLQMKGEQPSPEVQVQTLKGTLSYGDPTAKGNHGTNKRRTPNEKAKMV